MTLATDLNQPSTEAALSVLAASGWSLRGISREWDIPRGQLVRIADRAGLDFSQPKKERVPVNMSELERLYRKGMSLAEIGRRLGVSDETVARRLVSAGLRGAKPSKPCKFCHSPAKAKGMCHAHYMRERRAAAAPTMTAAQRVHDLCVRVAPYVQGMPEELAREWAGYLTHNI